MTRERFWSLNKAIVLLLVGGFLMLLVEIRYEHRDVVADERAALIPIVFAAIGALVAAASLPAWRRGGRRALQAAFAASVIVGALGVWFHTDGRPWAALDVLRPGAPAVTAPEPAREDNEAREHETAVPGLVQTVSETGATEDSGGPPALAPLAFVGLGLIGLAACSTRLRAET